jgi:hypothetical protein
VPGFAAWLWPHRLALGKLAIFDGDPNLGKSLVTLGLCARLSSGRPFPDAAPSPGPASSIVINGEDGVGGLPLLPRPPGIFVEQRGHRPGLVCCAPAELGFGQRSPGEADTFFSEDSLMRTITTSLLLTVGLYIGLAGVTAAFTPAQQTRQPPGDKPGKPHITVGKETTYITGPLDKEGYPDYIAALNERLKGGATPENNAAVLLWKAHGPRPEGGKMPPEFFQYLGIAEPPEQGDYFVWLVPYFKDHLKKEADDETFKRLDRARQRSWTAKEYPDLAGWLRHNEKPLAVVIEGTKRSHYFSPLVPSKSDKGPGSLIGALISSPARTREFAMALTARAALRVGEGRNDDAWQDLLVCHRLARLVARGTTIIEKLIGIAIDTMAGEADLVLLDRTKLDAKQIRACLQDLRNLPALPPVADSVDLCERFSFLQTVTLVDRYGLQFLEGLSGGGQKEVSPVLKPWEGKIDWDPALRNGNRVFDRLTAALRLKERPAREKQLQQVILELKELKAGTVEALTKALQDPKATPELRGKVLGDVLLSLMVPATHKVQDAGDRSEQLGRNLQIAFALAAYQRDHGKYSQKLAELAPKYLAAVPVDLFTGKPLVYRQEADGYLLYSFGLNGQDDQGRSYDDNPPGDDLRVRLPLPPLK